MDDQRYEQRWLIDRDPHRTVEVERLTDAEAYRLEHAEDLMREAGFCRAA
jgi:hypothetical protein